MNKYCYCQKPLQEEDNPGTHVNCHCCCNNIKANDKSIYGCPDERICWYKKINTTCYFICVRCYNSRDDDNKRNEQERHELIYTKFKSSINAISYMFYFLYIYICHGLLFLLLDVQKRK